VTGDYTCPSLVYRPNTSDGPVGMPVTGVCIACDRLFKTTVTSIQDVPVALRCGWPVTRMLHHGYSIVL
jgi:hypothetical protein